MRVGVGVTPNPNPNPNQVGEIIEINDADCWWHAKLTRTRRGLRRVRTGCAYRPPALGTYRRRRAACPQGPTYCAYWARGPASGVRCGPRSLVITPGGRRACRVSRARASRRCSASRTRSRTSASAARCDHVRGSRWRRPPSRGRRECYGRGSAVEIKLHEFAGLPHVCLRPNHREC